MYTALDQNRKCASEYLDLAKTFDIIEHNILLGIKTRKHPNKRLGLKMY